MSQKSKPEPFETFLKKFFSIEKGFEVNIEGDDFPKVDLIIKVKDKSNFNYDFIFVEAKNRTSIRENNVTNFVSDVEKSDFDKFNILGLFCCTKEFPKPHYNKIFDSSRLILPIDKRVIERFFGSSYKIIDFLNILINEMLDKQKEVLIKAEKARTESI